MRVAFYTLGCKVNQFETDSLCEMFREKGAEIIPFGEEADFYIVNTCAVTAKAAYQSRQIMRRIKKNHPGSRIVATGCYTQVGAQEILDALSWEVCLVGNDQKYLLPELSLSGDMCLEYYMGEVEKIREIAPFFVKRPMEKTRAYLKIQDGCNSFCGYCIVPYARGRSRSLSLKQVFEQVYIYEKEGIKEVVLTGIHIGQYGKDLGDDINLFKLLQEICKTFPGMRFRLSSIEPTEISPEMLLWARETENFAPHFHIPLQSGSDRILKAMNRRYNASLYRKLILNIREIFQDAAIGADVLVGFSGEEEADFKKTLELIESLPITYVHAFPYSRRPFTQASGMPDTVTKAEKTQRVRAVRAVGERKRLEFYRSQKGMIHECLVEERNKTTGLMRGTTSNYIPVHILESGEMERLKNQMVKLKISKIARDKIFGELL